MSIRRCLIFTIWVLAGAECILLLIWVQHRRLAAIQSVPPTMATEIVAMPPERTSFAGFLFDERNAETVMIVTLDIPGVVKGKRMELPLRRVKESEMLNGGEGFMECADGASGGMDTFLYVFPEFKQGSETDARLDLNVSWALWEKKGSIDQVIKTRVGESREMDLPNSVHMKIEFRSPHLPSTEPSTAP